MPLRLQSHPINALCCLFLLNQRTPHAADTTCQLDVPHNALGCLLLTWGTPHADSASPVHVPDNAMC